MKYLLYICFIVSAFAGDKQDPRVKYFPLDKNLGFTVYCSPNSEVPTTIDFPSEISEILKTKVLLAGQEVAEADYHKYPFTIEHRPGANYFAVYSRGIEGDRAAINVVYQGEHIIIDFETSKKADRIVYYRKNIVKGKVIGNPQPVTKEILISQMDKVKSYHMHEAGAVQDIIFHPAKSKYDRTDYIVTIDEVFNVTKLGTLYFRVVIDNKTNETLKFNPKTFGVNVGSVTLVNTLSQSSGIISPLGQNISWYAFTNDGLAKPLRIDPRKNKFIPLLKVIKASDKIPKVIPQPAKQVEVENANRKIRRIRTMREMKTQPLEEKK